MIANINYKGQLASGELDQIDFTNIKVPPLQNVIKSSVGSCMVVFPSGKFRLMGVKKPLSGRDYTRLPLFPKSIELQSVTITDTFGDYINQITMANRLTSRRCMFEPELFPAARLLEFNPLCVNVFATGKIVILGLKNVDSFTELLVSVRCVILSAVN